ncbi:hypothetical protein GYMLUDRAFT_252729 [Collybiopsis luxurians FD-317 M1]|uniref:Uncharacterized protein n=1 Tax=Collybiopsis luxurians FD-317 M1 TaxID=944289 RepID=A0A0D0BZB0_9AGAR|nr:hypothetical protein GYMLUDRAFT_252729 [Collybiopsis luxurians FD-317 M1]
MTGARIKAERALEMGGGRVGVIRVFRQLPYLRREQRRRERLYRHRYFQCQCIFGVGNTIISIIVIISPSLSSSGSGICDYNPLSSFSTDSSPNHIRPSPISPSHSEPSPSHTNPNARYPPLPPSPTPPPPVSPPDIGKTTPSTL